MTFPVQLKPFLGKKRIGLKLAHGKKKPLVKISVAVISIFLSFFAPDALNVK